MTADHILLHAFEIIGLTVDGSLVEHLGGLLERCRRHERRCLESGTGDALEYLLGSRRHGVAHYYRTEVAAFESGIFVTQLAGCNNLAWFE